MMHMDTNPTDTLRWATKRMDDYMVHRMIEAIEALGEAGAVTVLKTIEIEKRDRKLARTEWTSRHRQGGR